MLFATRLRRDPRGVEGLCSGRFAPLAVFLASAGFQVICQAHLYKSPFGAPYVGATVTDHPCGISDERCQVRGIGEVYDAERAHWLTRSRQEVKNLTAMARISSRNLKDVTRDLTTLII
jgi:hypothetical protein